jgi:hypothetical protein
VDERYKQYDLFTDPAEQGRNEGDAGGYAEYKKRNSVKCYLKGEF